jgi:hypothetical protein
MNWIEKFNEDSAKLTKKQFFIKYVLSILILIVGWFSLFTAINLFSTKKNLSHIKGTFREQKILTTNHYSKGRSYTTNDLQISIIENKYNYYTIKDRYIYSIYVYSNVEYSLSYGDSLDIYTENPICRHIWPFDKNEVYELDSRGKVLFDFKQVKDYLLFMFTISFGILITMIIYRVYQMRNKDNPNNREIDGLLKAK